MSMHCRYPVLLIMIVLLPWACIPLPVSAEWTTYVYGTHAQVGALNTMDVPESSGLIASRTSADVFWTHNDSGAYAPRLWAFRLSAADITNGTPTALGYVEITNATLIDWEDLSAGPGQRLYIFDGGDNNAVRTNKRIYRIPEPTINPNGGLVALQAMAESIRFEYPDSGNPELPADENTERYDCEAMMVHPVSGDIYLVTKRDVNSDTVSRVYKLAADELTWDGTTIHVLEFIVDLTSVLGSTPLFSQITGGDLDAEGRRFVVRNYFPMAFEFILPDGQPFETIFSQAPNPVNLGSLFSEAQGEAIAYAADGGDLLTTSEGNPMAVYRTPWELANLRERKLRSNEVTIRWETATAATSQVDYGTTTSYGSQELSGIATTTHAVMLPGLSASTVYFYKVTSGAYSYPPAGKASAFAFETLGGVASDFDGDGDVDMVDFAFLQRCLSGESIAQCVPGCTPSFLDEDDDVDADDIAVFGGCLSGPALAADPACE